VIAVDIDIKINSIETSIREIKQLLVGFQATSFRHVNPELLKGTFQSVLTSLQSPLNQISAFLEEINVGAPTAGTKLSPKKSSLKEVASPSPPPEVPTSGDEASALTTAVDGNNSKEDLSAALKDLGSFDTNQSFSLPNDDLSADLEEKSETDDLSAALQDLDGNHNATDQSTLDSLSLPPSDLSATLRDLEEQPADDLSAALRDLEDKSNTNQSFSLPATGDLSAALRDLEGSGDATNDESRNQNDDLSAALRDLDFKSDNLPTESDNNFDDLTAALRGLGGKSNGESAELPSIQGLDDLSFPTDDLSAALRDLDNSSPAALSDLLSSLNSGEDFDFSALNAAAARLPKEEVPSFDFPPPSGKRKKQTNMRPIKMKGKGLMGLSFDDPEATLAELASIQSSEVPEPAPASEEDSLSASLKELPAATPSWLSMFSTPSAADAESTAPSSTSDKPRRSSRIGRSTPLPQRPAGKLYRDHGVRDDINKAGLRRVKKGKGIHASGKTVLQMEDVHVIIHPYGDDSNKALFCVFDGHVGKNCAVQAKSLFPGEFLNQLSLGGAGFDATEAFRNAYSIVDKQLAEYEYEGTTATTVYMWQVGETRYVQAANLGDSTAFLWYVLLLLPLQHSFHLPHLKPSLTLPP
jgi:hypothetical protein